MKRYKIIVSYLGTNYCGWQTQKNGTSVQSVLETRFKLFGAKPPLRAAAGRTPGCMLSDKSRISTRKRRSLPKNSFCDKHYAPRRRQGFELRGSIARFSRKVSGKRKTYVYKLYLSPHLNPLKNATAENICVPLDFAEMEKAARFIEGTHDFRCFEASGSSVKDTVRTVEKVEIIKNGEDVEIRVTGNGFLYNMVRIIAGTLVDVGKGKIAANDVEDIIKSGDRVRAGKTLPAKGLTLYSVKYK